MRGKKLVIIISTLFTVSLLWLSVSMLISYNVGLKYTIENICTETLGVRLTIGEVHVNSEQGTARLGHIQIFNPKGFSDGAAVEIENIDVAIDTSSRGLIRISEIDASNIQVNLEVRKTKNNIETITHKIDSIKPSRNPSDVEKLKAMVDVIKLHDNRVRPRTLLVANDRKTVTVPDMQLSQIGYTEKGLPLKQAIALAWNQIIPQFATVAAQAGFLQGMEAAPYVDQEEKEIQHGEDHLIDE